MLAVGVDKPMESSGTLAIESFSRSWLTSVDSSLHGLETPLRASLDSSHAEELEYKKMPMPRRSLEDDQNFIFDFPNCQSPDALLHADQLFSDGLIRPISINQSKIEASSSSLNLAPSTVPPSLSSTTVSAVQMICRFLGRWRRILPKCFGYVRSLSHGSVRASRIRSRRVDNNVERITAWEVKKQSNSREACPRRRAAPYSLDGCYSYYDSESSIHEAVLHCKRSMHKS